MKVPRRVPGHALTVEWNGETGVESASTGECSCGWCEHGSSQEVVREEYRWHLLRASKAEAAFHELTGAQKRLLLSLPDTREVHGSTLRVARALENKGLARIAIEGEMWKNHRNVLSLTKEGEALASRITDVREGTCF